MALNTTVVTKKTTNPETVKYIKKLSQEGAKNETLQAAAKYISQMDDPIKGVFDFAYNSAVYYPDPDERQILQPVHVTLRDGKANCVDYSILQSALLRILGIKHYYKMVSFDNAPDYDHIYIVANGKVLDPVIGQRQDGSQKKLNRTPHYNEEVGYVHKKNIPVASLEIMQGIKEINPQALIRTVRTRTGAARTGFIGYQNKFKKHGKTVGSIDWGSIAQSVPGLITAVSTAFNGPGQSSTPAAATPVSTAPTYVTPVTQSATTPVTTIKDSGSGISTTEILIGVGFLAAAGFAVFEMTKNKKRK